ncbi:DNA/RNA non-specific endonuclease [Cryobacterium breve]|uniref:DNA/RNA non-specific endonuclease n=1 Tax=Cryobacterium breve TaxID=1259258 RepID=UPI0030CAD0E1
MPLTEQTGEAVYAKNDLDRGHLVRRQDPVWGGSATARQANADTFAHTNAAPQAGAFNHSQALWLGLEDHTLTYARTNKNRISVFTASVLSIEDPVNRGTGIPQSFWKIAAWTTTINGSTVRRAARVVLDQSPQLADLDLDAASRRALTAGTPPPLGPHRTYQVPIADVAVLTGLNLTALAEADALAPLALIRNDVGPRELWVELTELSGVRLISICMRDAPSRFVSAMAPEYGPHRPATMEFRDCRVANDCREKHTGARILSGWGNRDGPVDRSAGVLLSISELGCTISALACTTPRRAEPFVRATEIKHGRARDVGRAASQAERETIMKNDSKSGVGIVEWQFFTSHNNTVGPDVALLERLERLGIPFTLWVA